MFESDDGGFSDFFDEAKTQVSFTKSIKKTNLFVFVMNVYKDAKK